MTGPIQFDSESFRRQGHAAVDWVADYLERVESLPVQATVAPGDIAALLPTTPPEDGIPFEAILADLDRVILPGITNWQSPNWFAFFPSNASPPSMLADLISSGLGVQGMLWATSPACTEVETRMLDWMAQLLNLGDRFLSTGSGGGVIQDTASSSAICVMLAALHRRSAGSVTQQGLAKTGTTFTAYTSTQAHSSIEKAAGIIGLGRDQLRLIDVDASYAMRPDELRRSVEADILAGHRPFFVSATVGTTASGAFDSLPELLSICRSHDLWLHVDAAMFGTAACCSEFAWIQTGCEDADSYTVNPHKWMLVNFDCNCLWVADSEALTSALSVMPEYLRNQPTESGDVIDYRDWQIPLGRRFRALKLWFVLRHYGARGIRAMVRHHVELTRTLIEWIEADSNFEILAPAPLTLVCFAHVDGDARTKAILDAVNASGKLAVSHATLETAEGPRLVIRFSVGQWRTTRRHVEAAWALISKM